MLCCFISYSVSVYSECVFSYMHGYDSIAQNNKGQRGVLSVLTGFGYVLLTAASIMLPGLTRLW